MAPQRNQSSPRGQHQGLLLVASPYASHTNFARQVILLLEHGERGTLGVVVDEQLRDGILELRRGDQRTTVTVRGGADAAENVRVGLVSWKPGELQAELAQGVWLRAPLQQQMVLDTGDLWSNLVRDVGRAVLRESLGIVTQDVDPWQN